MVAKEFKEFEALAWERKAHLYDFNWGLVTSQVVERLVGWIDPPPGSESLDIGCGPGHLCAKLASLGCTATGCDFSHAMISLARARHPGVTFHREDADSLSYEDASFDVVTLNYLLLHVAEPERTLNEAVRVLQPSGKLAYTLWLPPAESSGLNLILGALRRHADLSVVPPGPDIFEFASEVRARLYFEMRGFESVEAHTYEAIWSVKSALEFFDGVQAGSRMGGLVELQSGDIKARLLEDFEERLEEFREGDGFRIPLPSIVIIATKGRMR